MDAVKFQSYSAEKLVKKDEKSLPQAQRAGYSTQFERFKDLEFTEFEWEQIIRECKAQNVDFLTTCFDLESLKYFLPKMKYVKIASGDLTYERLIREARKSGKHTILSTGMASHEEIDEVCSTFHRENFTVMHCVSSYPCPDEHANLGVISELVKKYHSVGYSDHTQGITACMIAAALGCEVIEKHFTDDSSKAYGDHCLSAEPDEMKVLVEQCKNIPKMMGAQKPCDIETINKKRLRRGIYAAQEIQFGSPICERDLIELRPLTKNTFNDVIGKRAKKHHLPGQPIDA